MNTNYPNYPMLVYPIRFYNGRIEWAVEFPNLPGCAGGGDTPAEAVEDAMQTLPCYLDAMVEDGMELPEPLDFTEKFINEDEANLCLDASLIEQLAVIAEDNDMTVEGLLETILTSFIEEAKSFDNPEEADSEESPILNITMNSELFQKLEDKAKDLGMDLETYIGYVLTKDASNIVYPQPQAKFNRWDLG